MKFGAGKAYGHLFTALDLHPPKKTSRGRPRRTPATSLTEYIWRVIILLGVLLSIVIATLRTVLGAYYCLEKLQLLLFQKLPTRLITRINGKLARSRTPLSLRAPLFSAFVGLFNVNMDEAIESDLKKYSNFHSLFTRTLKDGVRPIAADHPLVSPADGTVLHFGKVENGLIEQVKGVNYQLEDFLGPGSVRECKERGSRRHWYNVDIPEEERALPAFVPSKGKELYHMVVYLGIGDYHHFHSPTDWSAQARRHITGELFTVAPWALKILPSLFTLNERVVLSGSWQYGFFSLTAVGAYNVGSIKLDLDEELETNVEQSETGGRVRSGEFSDKFLGDSQEGVALGKGEHIGLFNFGSTMVIVFEAPKNFNFVVEPGRRVLYGQPLGRLMGQAHIESDLE